MKSIARAYTNFSFSGRVSRKEFWPFFFFYWISLLIAMFVDALFDLYPFTYFEYGVCTIIVVLVVGIPFLSLQFKRLHDIGLSGTWVIAGTIPVLGPILQICFYTRKSKMESNKYGSIPYDVVEAEARKAEKTAVKEDTESFPLEPVEAEPPQIRFCRSCGNALNDGSNFCPYCGTRVLKDW